MRVFVAGWVVLVSGGCGASNSVYTVARPPLTPVGQAAQLGQLPPPFEGRTMKALHAALPIPGSALARFPHINPVPGSAGSPQRGVQNTADNDSGGQSGYIIDPGSVSGDGGIYVAMTAYDDAWVTTPTDRSYNTVNAPTTHGPNGNCIETVTNYYNGFGTPGTTVDQVQFYDFCKNNGQGAFVGAIPMDANFVRDYVRTYADPIRPMPRYISVVAYAAADRRYHAYLYDATLTKYVDYYDSAPGATTNALGSEGWSIYETHYRGGDCTALPDASEEAIQIHTAAGWQLLSGSQVSSYVWGTCFSAPFTDPYNVPAFSTSPSVAWTVTSPVAAALSAYARVILADVPRAYYRLGDSGPVAVDSSGSNLNGTYGPSVVRDVPSLLESESQNGAALFPGGTSTPASFITIPAAPQLQPPIGVSVEAWLQETRAPTNTSDLVVYGSRSTGLSYTLQVSANNTVLGYVTTSTGYGLVTSKTVLSARRPYLLDFTDDGSALSIYIDGSLDASSKTTGLLAYASPNSSNGLSIGSANDSTRPVFSGTLDEVAVFAGALTAAQIGAHWTAGSGLAVAPSTPQYASLISADAPLVFYQLDDTTSVAADAGPNHIDATYGTAVTRGSAGLLASEPTYTAAKFPGGTSSVNSAVSAGRNAALEPPQTVSLEAWVQPQANRSVTVDLVSYGPEKLGQPYTLQLLPNGTVAMYATTATGYGFVQGVTSLRLNAPHLIDGTYGGSTLRVYVDGALDASAPATGALSYSRESAPYGLSLGTAFDTYRPAFNGILDDVAVYGTPLSAARVSEHWAVGSGHAAGP